MHHISIEDRFLFDLQGFLILRDVLAPAQCQAALAAIETLKTREYPDEWKNALTPDLREKALPTCDRRTPGHVRFNGLLSLDTAFDVAIAHERVLPCLREFMGDPQLINTWAIEKARGSDTGQWHRGIAPSDYRVCDGEIRTRMLNVVFLLTDNGPEDGCVVAVPGSHKNNIDIDWASYKNYQMPGALAITGKAGDVFLFSEAVMHNGLPKTTEGLRTNLYFNYVTPDMDVLQIEPANGHHFLVPPAVRARFSPDQKAVTHWVEKSQRID